MTTGHRKTYDSELRQAATYVRKQLRIGLNASRLAVAASFLWLPVNPLLAQEKEPSRIFRGGLIQQLRSLTEDSGPSRAEAPTAKKSTEAHLTDDPPKIPKPRPVGEKSRASTPTESRSANLRNSQSKSPSPTRTTSPPSDPDAKLPTPGSLNAAKPPRSNNQAISNESAEVSSKSKRSPELGVAVTNPKLANEARFQLSDKKESNSEAYSASSIYDPARAKDAGAIVDKTRVFSDAPKVQAVESMSQAPKVSRKPLPASAKTAVKANESPTLKPEQAAAPKRIASNSGPTQAATPVPTGLKPTGSTFSLEQSNSPEFASSPKPVTPEYPSLKVPSFATPGATSPQKTAVTSNSTNTPSALNAPQPSSPSSSLAKPTANLNTPAQTRSTEPKPAGLPLPEIKPPESKLAANSLELPAIPGGLPSPFVLPGAVPPPPALPSAGSSAPSAKSSKPNSAGTSAALGTQIANLSNPPAAMAPRSTNPIRSNASALSADDHMAMETPRLQVVLKGPQDMPVGTPADYQIVVRNVDDIQLDGLVLRLEIPGGVAVSQSKPSHGELNTERTPDGATLVTWSFAELAAYQSASAPLQLTAKSPRNFAVAMEWTLLPKTGEAQFAVRQAQLELALEGPSEAEFGAANLYRLHVRNPGTATAKNVKVKLGAASFGSTDTQIDEILAGQQQSIDVELTFNEKGTININAEATATELRSAASIKVLVKQAYVTTAITGSDRVYHGSPSSYEVKVHNSGDLDSRMVRAELNIPEGAEVLAKPAGATLVNNRLTWEIPAVKVGQTLAFPVELNLWTAGEHKLTVACSNAKGKPTVASMSTIVEAIADLKLVVNDPIAPAPVGGMVTYEMNITNRGSRAATNVRAVAQFSDGIEPVQADGAQHRIVTGQVIFEPLVRIEAGETKVLRVQAKAAAAGTHRFRAEVRSDESELRLVQEETTQYLDSASRIASPINNSSVVR